MVRSPVRCSCRPSRWPEFLNNTVSEPAAAAHRFIVMNKMKKLLSLFVVFIVAATAFQLSAAKSASDIMGAMRSKLVSAKAVELLFTMPGNSGDVQGNAILSGASFVFHTPQMSVWYDGKTQWAYMQSTKEVNITEPSAEELSASNPFAILDSYHKSYKARRLADAAGRYCVELTPVSKGSGIAKILVYSDIKTNWPAAVSITFDDGRRIDLTVDNVKAVPEVPATTFRYDQKRYPASEIIDLR